MHIQFARLLAGISISAVERMARVSVDCIVAFMQRLNVRGGMKKTESALRKRLAEIEKELESSRATVLEDGWQTQRFARKSRKWDYLAQEKMKIIQQLNEDGK